MAGEARHLRDRVRHALGVTGEQTGAGLEEAVFSGAGFGPLVTLSVLAALVPLQGIVLLLADDIGRSVGASARDVGVSALTWWALGLVAAIPFVLRLASTGRRRLQAASGATLVLVGQAALALAGTTRGIAMASAVAGAGAAALAAGTKPWLVDLFPPLARVRTLALAKAVQLAVLVVGLLVAFPLAGSTALTWRGSLLTLLIPGLAALLALVALPDVPTGSMEDESVEMLSGAASPGSPSETAIAEGMRRVMAAPSSSPLLLGFAGLGLTLFTAVIYGSYLLQERDGASPVEVALILSGAAVLGIVAVLSVASRGEVQFRVAPRWLGGDLATLFALTAFALLVLAFVPGTVGAGIGMALAVTCLAVGSALLDQLSLSALLPRVRPWGQVMSAVAVGPLGLALGGSFVGAADGRYGLSVATCAAVGAAVIAAVVVARVRFTADADVASVADALLERATSAQARSAGAVEPLLSARGISFSYGLLQILFDIDFEVADGETVALLGTNGAGKSTLLRVVSGLGTPSAGAIRFRGEDITFLDATARVKAGITQIPGGKAVFGPLSVAENLKLYGYALGRDRKAVDRGVEEGFAAFPRLHERRNSPASTLSGGEQQMLALTKALILKPRLLCIDELSLGLAPKVVGELLEMVRRISATGTSIILVEQSVNVALTVAQRAYFLEKGAVRFEGQTAELLERPDIFRSVFLEGATAK